MKINAPLGTVNPIRVDGVGFMQWAPDGFHGVPLDNAIGKKLLASPNAFVAPDLFGDEMYVFQPAFHTPTIKGFNLRLILDEGLDGEDLEIYRKTHHKIDYEPTVDHFTVMGGDHRFPGWLIEFASDLMDWTRAEEVRVIEEDTYPGEQSSFIDVEIDYEYYNPVGIDPSILINNHDVFLGTAAVHLAKLRSRRD